MKRVMTVEQRDRCRYVTCQGNKTNPTEGRNGNANATGTNSGVGQKWSGGKSPECPVSPRTGGESRGVFSGVEEKESFRGGWSEPRRIREEPERESARVDKPYEIVELSSATCQASIYPESRRQEETAWNTGNRGQNCPGRNDQDT